MPEFMRRMPRWAFLIGVVVGLVLTYYGVTELLPTAGIFGVLFTLIGLAITLVHAYNVLHWPRIVREAERRERDSER